MQASVVYVKMLERRLCLVRFMHHAHVEDHSDRERNTMMRTMHDGRLRSRPEYGVDSLTRLLLLQHEPSSRWRAVVADIAKCCGFQSRTQ